MYILCINRITTLFMDVTNMWQTGDKIGKMWQIFDQTWKPLVLLGFWGVEKVTKFVPCDKNGTKNVTNCQNMHKYTILCIKMNNYTENLSHLGQKWGQTCDKLRTKFVITRVRCDQLETKFIITRVRCDK